MSNTVTNLQEIVSDYVAGRLDPISALQVEAAAQTDQRVAQAIGEAQILHRRVVQRLAKTAGGDEAPPEDGKIDRRK